MLDGDIWVGLVNTELNTCIGGSSNDCNGKFRWATDDFPTVATLEGNVDADGDGMCFAMSNDSRVRDQSCRKVAKFACEFSCEYCE